MFRTCFPVAREGVLEDAEDAKSIFSAIVSCPVGIRSIERSSINTRCWICRGDSFVFCLAGFRDKTGLPWWSNPRSHCLPVSFSGEIRSAVSPVGLYSLRQRRVEMRRD